MTRYARQMILPEVGEEGQKRLEAAHVVVIGAGGLAAGALPLLAGAGLNLTIIDPDCVDLSNLHRQHLFTETDCGSAKATAAASRCRAINSDICVRALDFRLTPENVETLVSDSDVVLDCADSYAVSYLLSDHCLGRVPLITASVLGFGGYIAGVCGKAPSLRAVFPDAPANTASCATAGVMGPVVSTLGAMQAQMALSVLLGLSPSPLGQVLNMDARNWRMSCFRFDGAPEPEGAFAFEALSRLDEDDIVVDLRGRDEAPNLIHPQAVRLRPEELAGRLPMRTGRLVLACSSGLRAWRAAESLYPEWPGEIVLVAATAS